MEKTKEQVQEEFIRCLKNIAGYWEKLPNKTTKERLEGAMFSVLAVLDGEQPSLPGFQVIPNPHPDDKKFHEKEGEDWYPRIDIAGTLHNRWHK